MDFVTLEGGWRVWRTRPAAGPAQIVAAARRAIAGEWGRYVLLDTFGFTARWRQLAAERLGGVDLPDEVAGKLRYMIIDRQPVGSPAVFWVDGRPPPVRQPVDLDLLEEEQRGTLQ